MLRIDRTILLLLTPSIFLLALPSLEYRFLQIPSYTYEDTISLYQTVHIIEVDPNLYDIRPIKALDNGIGRESVLSINERYGALASINGGFFSMGGSFDGKAAGVLKIDDWYAIGKKPRGAIGWSSKNQNPIMDRLLVDMKVLYDSNAILPDGLNCMRKQGEMILYTPCFHKTTLSKQDGREIIVKDGLVASIVKKGSSKIPENGFVLSIQESHPLIDHFQVGTPITIDPQINPLMGLTLAKDWDDLDYIIGGAPLLIHDGEKITDFEKEQTLSTFLSNRHARTAVGILPNGNWIFVIVDKLGLFDGMTVLELTDFMMQLGCIKALNLDGGGSSTMVYENVIKNFPRGDEDEALTHNSVRRVSDAIAIFSKK